jgi:hypothetical protein
LAKRVMDKDNTIIIGEKVIQTNGLYSERKTEMETIHNYLIAQVAIMGFATTIIECSMEKFIK